MRDFKIGQIVKCIECNDNHSVIGEIGKVIIIRRETRIGVEFFKPIPSGHNCGGIGKARHCWNIDAINIKLIVGELEEIE